MSSTNSDAANTAAASSTGEEPGMKSLSARLDTLIAERDAKLDARCKKLLNMWPQMKQAYAGDEYVVKIRRQGNPHGADVHRPCPAPRFAK